MGFVSSKSDFKEYYQEADIVSDYDKYRSMNLRKRVVRNLERDTAVKEIPNDSSVLEIGFGTGFISEALVAKGCKLRGVDTSEEMLKFASMKLGEESGVKLSLGSIFELDKVDGEFDASLSVRVYIHLKAEDSQKALFQMTQKVHKDGLIVFDVPSNSHIKGFIDKYKTLFGKKKQVINFKYSKDDVMKLVNSVDGISIYKLYSVDHLGPLAPLYALGYLLNFNWYERFVLNVEEKLLNLHFGHTKWFIVCQKDE